MIDIGIIIVPAMRAFARSATADEDVPRIVSMMQLICMAIAALPFVPAAHRRIS